jgi:hypothetical protein
MGNTPPATPWPSVSPTVSREPTGVCSGGNGIMSFRDVIEQSLNGSGNSNSAIPPQSIVGGTEVRLDASHAFLFLSAYQLKLSHATYPSSP